MPDGFTPGGFRGGFRGPRDGRGFRRFPRFFFPFFFGFPRPRCFFIDRFGRCCDRWGRCWGYSPWAAADDSVAAMAEMNVPMPMPMEDMYDIPENPYMPNNMYDIYDND